MTRRAPQVAVDLDLESARTEREHEEGKKSALQHETLIIAGEKKKLKEDHEQTKKDIEEELAVIKEKSEKEREAILVRNNQVKLENNELEKRNSELKRERDFAEQKLKEETEVGERKIAIIRQEITDLSHEHDLKVSEVKELTDTLKVIKKQYSDTLHDFTSLKERKEQLAIENESLVEKHRKDEIAFSEFKKLSTEKEKQMEEVDRGLKEKNNELAEVSLKIGKAQDDLKKIESKIGEIEEREMAANDRMKKAAELEVHVTKKLSELKEIESHFTSEHLARIGYTKTG